MLTKNVYILYPPGYSGSFISWAINISDRDLHDHTVDNPINFSNSNTFGGAGTSHLHTRIPTHQDIDQHLNWVLYNRPTEPKVYIINARGYIVYRSISMIAQHDPNGVFINIHANNDPVMGAFGTINCVTKWPIYLPGIMQLNPFLAYKPLHPEFDAYNCSNDVKFRNWMVENDYRIFYHNQKLNQEQVDGSLQGHRNWYRVRSSAHPHEVNESMYIGNPDLTNRLFEVSCLDVSKPEFLSWLADFMMQSQVSDSYDLSHVSKIHPDYCSVQSNLQWFDSIEHWERTGELDDYLLSHSAIQAQVINLIFKHSGKVFLTESQQDNWISFYARCHGPSWPPVSLDEYDFFKFPKCIQDEILNFGYKLHIPTTPILPVVELDWENMSLIEINDVYQQHKPRS